MFDPKKKLTDAELAELQAKLNGAATGVSPMAAGIGGVILGVLLSALKDEAKPEAVKPRGEAAQPAPVAAPPLDEGRCTAALLAQHTFSESRLMTLRNELKAFGEAIQANNETGGYEENLSYHTVFEVVAMLDRHFDKLDDEPHRKWLAQQVRTADVNLFPQRDPKSRVF